MGTDQHERPEVCQVSGEHRLKQGFGGIHLWRCRGRQEIHEPDASAELDCEYFSCCSGAFVNISATAQHRQIQVGLLYRFIDSDGIVLSIKLSIWLTDTSKPTCWFDWQLQGSLHVGLIDQLGLPVHLIGRYRYAYLSVRLTDTSRLICWFDWHIQVRLPVDLIVGYNLQVPVYIS